MAYPTAPGGERLHSGSSLNERGQFVAKIPDGRTALWGRGTVTPITTEGVPAEVAGLSDRGQASGFQGDGRGYLGFSPFTWTRARGLTPLPTGRFGAEWSLAAVQSNDRGQLLGAAMFRVPPGITPSSQAIAWDRGRLTEPAKPLVSCSQAEGCINDRGQVAGTLDVWGDSRAAIWQIGGDVVDLGSLGGTDSYATALNDAGDVVGWSYTATGQLHAVLWRDGEIVDLGAPDGGRSQAEDINERGEVIGTIRRPGETDDSAFLWRDGELTELGSLGGDGDTRPVDINDRGQVVGSSPAPDGRVHAVLWQDGEVVDLGALADSEESQAIEINDRGQILGRAGTRWADPVILWTAPAGGRG